MKPLKSLEFSVYGSKPAFPSVWRAPGSIGGASEGYRLSVLNDNPRSRQNSFRLNPLDSYSATNCSTSYRLRKRPYVRTHVLHSCPYFIINFIA